MKLDKYETEILNAFESGALKPVASGTDYQAVARNTMKKNRKINISEHFLSYAHRGILSGVKEGARYEEDVSSD